MEHQQREALGFDQKKNLPGNQCRPEAGSSHIVAPKEGPSTVFRSTRTVVSMEEQARQEAWYCSSVFFITDYLEHTDQ